MVPAGMVMSVAESFQEPWPWSHVLGEAGDALMMGGLVAWGFWVWIGWIQMARARRSSTIGFWLLAGAQHAAWLPIIGSPATYGPLTAVPFVYSCCLLLICLAMAAAEWRSWVEPTRSVPVTGDR